MEALSVRSKHQGPVFTMFSGSKHNASRSSHSKSGQKSPIKRRGAIIKHVDHHSALDSIDPYAKYNRAVSMSGGDTNKDERRGSATSCESVKVENVDHEMVAEESPDEESMTVSVHLEVADAPEEPFLKTLSGKVIEIKPMVLHDELLEKTSLLTLVTEGDDGNIEVQIPTHDFIDREVTTIINTNPDILTPPEEEESDEEDFADVSETLEEALNDPKLISEGRKNLEKCIEKPQPQAVLKFEQQSSGIQVRPLMKYASDSDDDDGTFSHKIRGPLDPADSANLMVPGDMADEGALTDFENIDE